ncbi:hypothetical protein [Paenibacillus harenae]|uniref:hypothetical protein n=1 Tax=Paenibacillus harenae TaxID=306543 RepID=UPI0012EBAC9A|nr:hypothetical protein [Paenibacillus harenae]
MDIIELRIPWRQVEIIQLRLIVQLGRHSMEAAVQLHFDKASQFVKRPEGQRVIRNPLFRGGFVAGRAAKRLRHLRPTRNQPPVIPLPVIPAVHTINVIAMKPQKFFSKSRRRHSPRGHMIRMMPHAVLI